MKKWVVALRQEKLHYRRQEIVHVDFALLADRRVTRNNGTLDENYDRIVRGIAGDGTGGIWQENTLL